MTPTPSPKPTPFQRLLTAASEHATDAGLFVLSLGTVAATAMAGTPPEALAGFLGGVGWTAFGKLFDIATDDNLTEETLRAALRDELAALPDGWQAELATLHASLEGQHTFLAEALDGVPHAVAAQLADELERQRLLTTDGVKYLRREMVDVKRMVGEGQKALNQRVRDGVIYLRQEIVDVKRVVREESEHTRDAIEDLSEQIQQGFARLAPQPGLGKFSLPGRPTHFIGREDLLAQVKTLQPGHLLTLWGAGGMGKTTLAAQALWDLHDAGDLLRRFPEGVLVYDFYGEPSPTGVYERIIYHFAAPPPGAKIEATREAARAALAGKRALLVLDGAENTSHLRDVLDARGLCGVLIISRKPADVVDTGLEVTPLDEPHGIALLQTWGKQFAADLDACKGIYTLVGELTLALELAGKYMHATHTPAADVLADLQTALLNVPELGQHRRDSVSVLLAKSVAALTEGVKDALAVMGLLANRPFPFALLAASLNVEPASARKLVAELIAHGLATRENDTLRARHALVHAYAREFITPPETAPARLTDALARAAIAANKTGLPTRYAPLRPHVTEAAVWAEEQGLENAGTLWNEQGYHLNMVGNYAEARAAYGQALAIDEVAFGSAHPNVVRAFNNLGQVMKAQGDYVGAAAAYGQALAIDETAFGPDHPDVAIVVNNLGEVMRAQGNYDGALAAYARALVIWTQAFGEEHSQVAAAHNNLGAVMDAQGDYAGARAAYERVLDILEKTLPPEHPYVAVTHNNLGSVMRAQGDYAGARAVFERALAIDEAAFGPDHPNVAIRVNNLAGVMYDQGDYAGARAAFERAMAIFERFLGVDHPNTKIVRGNLEALGPGETENEGNVERRM